jgi:hypothetical protein
MDPIDRYLESIRWFLPSQSRDDILAELRDVLITRREEKAAELGRPLTRAEDEDLLRAFGNPLGVAARYGRQRYLIGPEVYPVWELVLKIVLLGVGASAVITAIVATAVGQGDATHGLLRGIAVAWDGGFVSIGIVTVVFAVMERSGAFRRMAQTWRVRDLPRVPRRRRQRRENWIDWVSSIVVNFLFMLWWLGVIHFWPADVPTKAGGLMHFAFAPDLQVFYWPLLALAATNIGVNLLKLASSESRPIGMGLQLAVQAAAIVMAALALHAGHWAVVTGVGVAPNVLAETQHGLEIGAEVTLICTICGILIGMATTAWRLFRSASTAGHATNGA